MEMDEDFKAEIVSMIIQGRTIDAIKKLSDSYGIDPPRIKVGRVKGKSRALAVYIPRTKTIIIQNGELFNNPFVVLHEYYHHLRYQDKRHRGTEQNADKYAASFIQAFKSKVSSKKHT